MCVCRKNQCIVNQPAVIRIESSANGLTLCAVGFSLILAISCTVLVYLSRNLTEEDITNWNDKEYDRETEIMENWRQKYDAMLLPTLTVVTFMSCFFILGTYEARR